MPVPKRKRSRARRDKRFANWGIAIKQLTACSNCDVAIMPHQACSSCGYYKGAKVMNTKSDRSVGRQELRTAKQSRGSAAAPPVVEAETQE